MTQRRKLSGGAMNVLPTAAETQHISLLSDISPNTFRAQIHSHQRELCWEFACPLMDQCMWHKSPVCLNYAHEALLLYYLGPVLRSCWGFDSDWSQSLPGINKVFLILIALVQLAFGFAVSSPCFK